MRGRCDGVEAVALGRLRQSDADNGELEAGGGLDYLVDLAKSVPSAANAPHYAGIVVEKARRRSIIDAASEVVHTAYTAGDDTDVPAEAERMMFEATSTVSHTGAEHVGDRLREAMDMWLSPDKPRGLSTGFADLDKILNPLAPGHFVVIGAGTSQGKSVLATTIALTNALAGVPVGVFTLEMTTDELQARWVSQMSQVPLWALLAGIRSAEWRTRVFDAGTNLYDLPIHVDDTGGLSLAQLVSRGRRLIRRHGVKLLVVDYLHLMATPPEAQRMSRSEQIGALTRGLKAAAQSLGVPIISPSQLNRNVDTREDHVPRLSDLKESGSIEQDATAVLLLHRPNKDSEYGNDNHGIVRVAKQRNGALGEVTLAWSGETVTFESADSDAGRSVA